MIYASFQHPNTYRPLLTAPAWKEVLAWIENRDPDLPDGIHPIRGEEIFVNQHHYQTLSREECRWESHRRYIDLQFCLEGTEIIDVINRDFLTDDGPYDEEKDLLFHHPETRTADPAERDPPRRIGPGDSSSGIQYTPLTMTPGSIAIFTPADAHRPKVAAGPPSLVRKFVVKISIKALGDFDE